MRFARSDRCEKWVLRHVASKSYCVDVDKELDCAEEKRTKNGSLQSGQVCSSCNSQSCQVRVGPEGRSVVQLVVALL